MTLVGACARAHDLPARGYHRQQPESQIVKDPKVTAEVVTYRPFFVVGEV
jgi:protein involved in polysaccharide export with SLBB domain